LIVRRPFPRSLTRDQRGAVIIEMAMIAPVMAVLLIGMVDLGRGYSTKLQLEQAAQRAIEKVMNGHADKSSAAALRTEAATVAGVAESAVTVDFWLECDDTRKTNYDDTCNSGQVSRRYLTVSISKVFTPMFSTRFAGASANGTYTLVGRTGVRTQ
jgi:Flp pilus assembly protein TadG